jgi:poly-gamma-glutamate synthesis protein (capsule biosynthesis protein)
MRLLVCGDYIPDNITESSEIIFGDLLPFIKEADISVYNQEHPVTETSEMYATKRKGRVDSCSLKAMKPILGAKFKYASIATNHIFNKGIKGLNDTVSFFNDNGIKTFGAGKNIDDARKISFYEKEGVRISFLNFAENEFNIATDLHGGANPLNVIDNVAQIKEAKNESDFVIVIIHGGLEYCKYPTPRMIKQYRFYVDNGASAIITHHSHVVSGYEIYKGSPIFYGIGNLIPTKHLNTIFKNDDTRTTIAVDFNISKESIEVNPLIFKYNIEDNRLDFLVGKELTDYNNFQGNFLEIINDTSRLENCIFESYFTKERRVYYYTMFTRSNYFMFKLFRKLKILNLYDIFIETKMRMNSKNTKMWDMFRCEAHRDVLDFIYRKYIDTYIN